MKLKVFEGLIIASILITLSGCSTVKVISVNSDEDFSLADFKTYDFYKVDADIASMPEYEKRIEWIMDEIGNQLTLRELERSPEDPELLINIGIVLEQKDQTRETNIMTDMHYMGQRNYKWESEEIKIGEYLEGTFSIDFVEARTSILKCTTVSKGVIVEKDKNARKNLKIATEDVFKKIN